MTSVRLTSIVVYPIKAAAGISAMVWEVDAFGLQHDRRWMVVDSRGVMVSQRSHPRLALVRPTLHADRLTLDAPRGAVLDLPLSPTGSEVWKVSVWNDTCDALWLGPDPSRWLSEVLGSPCSLVYMCDATVRQADPGFAPARTRVSFADAFPFLLISEESLADLNSKLSRPIPMNRFRPNLVIAGVEPYGEDKLERFQVGAVSFHTVKPCARCVVTTTDQETARRSLEPLRTLATYRTRGSEVMFGQNLVHRGTGRLAVGAPVLV